MASKIAKRVLPAAIQRFSERGYHGTTTKEIAQAADVAESSLFLVFGKKEQLFEEALRKIAESQMPPEQFEELLSREGEFAEVVQTAIRRWYSTVTPDFARMAMYAALETPKVARTLIYRRVREFIKRLADAIDRHHGRRRGNRRSLVCSQNFMFGLFHFRLTRAVVDGETKHDMSEREYLDAALANFLGMIGALGGASGKVRSRTSERL
jgi:AcrR family transcriptional regulator